jgi:glycosyltransferase involved in cell wall biosynthesis
MGKVLCNALPASSTGAGISRYAFELAYHLAKLSDQVHIVISPEYKKYFPQSGCTYYFNRAPSTTTRILFDQFFLPFTFAPFSLVHYLDLAKPLFSRKPTILTLHDLCHLRDPHLFTLTQRFWRIFIGAHSLRRAARVICVSEFTKNEAREILKIPEDKLRVVHSGIRPMAGLQAKAHHASLKEPYILFVGTLIPRKNVIRLIQAFSCLKKENLKYKLIIAGRKGRVSRAFWNEIQGLDLHEVIFTGHVSDSQLAGLYKNASALVFPSLYEGFGFPALEAMTYGTPVVVSNVSALPEICGDAAYYVDPLEVEDLAQGIYQVLSDQDLRETLIQKGFERVKLFSWEKTAQETLKIYEELL